MDPPSKFLLDEHFLLCHLIFVNLFSVPPTSINISGYSEGSSVEIKEHDQLQLSCKVSGAKPKANITWYKKGVRFIPGESTSNKTCVFINVYLKTTYIFGFPESNIILQCSILDTSPSESSSDATDICSGCKTLTSKIKFQPTAQDNQASFGCKAEHSALPLNSPLRTQGTSVILSVLCKYIKYHIKTRISLIQTACQNVFLLSLLLSCMPTLLF